MKKGFTAIEILFVIMILGILMGFGFSNLKAVFPSLDHIEQQKSLKKMTEMIEECTTDYSEYIGDYTLRYCADQGQTYNQYIYDGKLTYTSMIYENGVKKKYYVEGLFKDFKKVTFTSQTCSSSLNPKGYEIKFFKKTSSGNFESTPTLSYNSCTNG